MSASRLAAAPRSRAARRVVVTGMGVVSPLGMCLDTVWRSVLDGRSGVVSVSASTSCWRCCPRVSLCRVREGTVR
jgi:hypothetical protein